jgi:hypothetical protein
VCGCRSSGSPGEYCDAALRELFQGAAGDLDSGYSLQGDSVYTFTGLGEVQAHQEAVPLVKHDEMEEALHERCLTLPRGRRNQIRPTATLCRSTADEFC